MKELGPLTPEQMLALMNKKYSCCFDEQGNRIRECICRDDFEWEVHDQLKEHLEKKP